MLLIKLHQRLTYDCVKAQECENTYEKTAYVRIVASRQASDIDLRTSPAMYSSELYGKPCHRIETSLISDESIIL